MQDSIQPPQICHHRYSQLKIQQSRHLVSAWPWLYANDHCRGSCSLCSSLTCMQASRSHLLIHDVLLSVFNDAVCYVLYYNYVAWCWAYCMYLCVCCINFLTIYCALCSFQCLCSHVHVHVCTCVHINVSILSACMHVRVCLCVCYMRTACGASVSVWTVKMYCSYCTCRL